MRFRAARHGLAVIIAVAAVVLAACAPAPPPPPAQNVAAPAPPPPPVTLPAAPGGASSAPLDPRDAPDPFVFSVDPSYCITASDPAPSACYFSYTTQTDLALVPLWRSTNLASWHRIDTEPGVTPVMPALAPWAEYGYHWAPSVLERPANAPSQRFVMWYTARQEGTNRQCLGVATAELPQGPYADNSSQPAYCQSPNGTIDASPFVDDNGTPYLVYKSDVTNQLWISRLAADGRSLVGGTEHLLWSGGTAPDAAVVEGPTMVRAAGQLYLLYSTDNWETASYRVGVVRCDSVDGPCHHVYSTSVLASRGAMLGPGGQTPFRDANGTWHLMFHAWTSPNVGYPAGARSLHLLPLTFTSTDVEVG